MKIVSRTEGRVHYHQEREQMIQRDEPIHALEIAPEAPLKTIAEDTSDRERCDERQ